MFFLLSPCRIRFISFVDLPLSAVVSTSNDNQVFSINLSVLLFLQETPHCSYKDPLFSKMLSNSLHLRYYYNVNL